MRMNRNQLVVLWCAIALIAAMCLYVPWIQPDSVKMMRNVDWGTDADCGYGLIFHLNGGQRIDAARLGIQCGLVTLIAAALIFTFRDPVKRP